MLDASGYPRFNNAPHQTLEVDQAHTIEPGLAVAGYGYLGLEEDVVMTEKGAENFTAPHREIVLING